MKVLYLLRYYPTLTETFALGEIRGVAAAGVEVTVARLGTRADGALQEDLPAVAVLDVPRRPISGWLGARTAGWRWLAQQQRSKDLARMSWLAHHIAGFDRIHVHFAGEAAELARAIHLDTGIPYTVTVHATDLYRPRPSLDAVLGSAEAVICVSQLARRQIRARLDAAGAGAVHVEVIPCGPDLTVWTPQPLPADPLRAAFVGRDVPKKGLAVLLDAWADLDRPGCTLDLVTDGAPPSLPPGARRVGLLPPSALRGLLGTCNLLVLPCQRAPDGDLDGVPLALMEAMALGRPVITTPVSGIPELVADDPAWARLGEAAVGWLVPPGDPAALCRALQRAADDPARRAACGAKGPTRLWERRFTLAEQVKGVLTLWRGTEAPV